MLTRVANERHVMRSLLIAGVAVAAAIVLAPLAHANPNQGDPCGNWHATTQGSSGQTLHCTHREDSGLQMYWEPSIQDSAYRTAPRGYKTDQLPFPHTPGGPPCNQNDGIVTHVTSGGNAIEDWGPAGCDNSKPMIDGPHH
jgi:hypothetical protein